MALRPPRLTQAPGPDAPPTIPPLADDPRYAEASRTLRVLHAAAERTEAEIDLLVLQQHLGAQAVTSTPSPRNELLRDRMRRRIRELAETAPEPAAPAAGEAVHPAVARALRLLQDGKAEPAQTRAKKLEELRQRSEILTDAVRAQGSVVEEIRRELSADLAEKLRDTHDEILRQMFETARVLAGLTDQERAFRARILQAGYDVVPDIISPPPVRALLMLGSEAQHDSAISGWRRLMQSRGLLHD